MQRTRRRPLAVTISPSSFFSNVRPLTMARGFSRVHETPLKTSFTVGVRVVGGLGPEATPTILRSGKKGSLPSLELAGMVKVDCGGSAGGAVLSAGFLALVSLGGAAAPPTAAHNTMAQRPRP